MTLLDIARQTDPKGAAARIAKVLQQVNPILQDMPWIPSNAPLGNRVTIEVALPSVGWGKLNKGITKSKGVVKQLTDTIGVLEGRSEVHTRMKKVVRDFQAHRAKEADRFLRAMSNEMATQVFYGNEASDESCFTGLQRRLETLATAITGSYVASKSGAGGGDSTSMYIVDWGEAGAHGIYPPETVGGLQEMDKGERDVLDADGLPMSAFVTEYEWWAGISVEDPRHIGRYCNVDISVATADTTATLLKGLIPILNGMPPLDGCRRVIYTRREIVTALHLQALTAVGGGLTIQQYYDTFVPHILGLPVVACDGISGNESAVT
jgi:hypothetical protein